MGKAYLVGAGPGDPALITVKGKQEIELADCIIYDRLIGEELLSLAKKDCELIYVGKENHHHVMGQEQINQLILDKSREYARVVRLKGGDPYIFGRGGEEALFLKEHQVEFEIIPGISSSVAVLTYAGIPITHRGIAKGFHVITSHSRKDELADIDYSLLVDEKETCVFLMGLSHVEEIAEGLMKAGRKPGTLAAVISNGTRPNQRKCLGTLENIGRLTEEQEMFSPAILVVGDVVGLEKDLDFWGGRPLWGQRYVVPYIQRGIFSFAEGWKNQKESLLSESIEELGAEVLSYPVGSIVPVNCDLQGLEGLRERDYLIFTSQNGVYACMWNLMEQGRDIRSLGRARIAAVGRKTEETLRQFGLLCDTVAKDMTGGGLAECLMEELEADTRLVWFSAREVSGELEEKLEKQCQFSRLICYENRDSELVLSEEERSRIASSQGIFFTSASNGSRFYKATGGLMPEKVFSIGPACSRRLRSLGITELEEAGECSYEGMLKLV